MMNALRARTERLSRWDDGPSFWIVLLGVFCLVGAGASLWGSRKTTGWWQDLLANLGVTFIGVLLTVFFVEQLVKKRERARWTPVRVVANRRLLEVATLLVNQIAENFPDRVRAHKFQVGISQHRMNPGRWPWILYDDSEWRSFIRHEVMPAAPQMVESLTSQDWKSLLDRLQYTEAKLEGIVQLFSAVLTPEQVAPVAALLEVIPTERDLIHYHTGRALNRRSPGLHSLMYYGLAIIEASSFDVPDEWRMMASPENVRRARARRRAALGRRARLIAAASSLVIVLSWVVVDALRGNWGRVAFGAIMGVTVVALLQVVTRLHLDPQDATKGITRMPPSWLASTWRKARGS